jgi:predicted nucleic acid-binding Zn ribbon protein
MPLYALICEKCGRALEETVMKISERDSARCPDKKCRGKLTNDYTRHETSNFQLKGGDWPSKNFKLEKAIMRGQD